LRKSHPNLHRRKFFQDRRIDPEAPNRLVNGDSEGDILWLRPDGKEMSQEEWHAGWVRCLGMLLNGRTLDDVNAVGEPIYDDTFLILCNPHHETIRFSLPHLRAGKIWELYLDTTQPVVGKRRKSRKLYHVTQRSLVVLVESSQTPPPAPKP
jgi:isoamylase